MAAGSSCSIIHNAQHIPLQSLQFGPFITLPPDTGVSSYTALLDLPPTQPIQLLRSPDSGDSHTFRSFSGNTTVKNEPMGTSSKPEVSDPMVEGKNLRPGKRREREMKGKGLTTKKVKNESCDDTEKLSYVHVRARRGQATDSHSLAERARRVKINARMKLLQDLVPGCNQITGTALVLDKIINHVQSLQRHVEFLSMKLAAVNPRIDFNLENILAAESGSFPSMVMPPCGQNIKSEMDNTSNINGISIQFSNHIVQWKKKNYNLHTSEKSLLSNDSSEYSALCTQIN